MIKNNGWLSDKVPLKRGIRQGCPVSALLFIIMVEILALKLKQSPHDGITVQIAGNSRQLKLSQYADDTCLFLSDGTQINSVLQIIKIFGNLAGPKLNLDKTEGIWIGNNNNSLPHSSLGKIKWPTEPVRCLGIFLGQDKKKCEYLNWWLKLEKIENQLNLWKMRKLTLIGKITVIKHLILPKLLFSCQFFETPCGFVKKFENLVYRFIWNSNDKIK